MSKAETFSVNLSLVQPALSKIEKELEDLNFRINEIYKRATIKNTPVVQSIVHYFDPTPEECKMLSKVWDRMAELVAKKKELETQASLLNGVTNQHDWLYEQVGDHTRDVDAFLSTLISETSNESDTP